MAKRGKNKNGVKHIVCLMGNISYKIKRTAEGLKCPCGNKELCKHIKKVIENRINIPCESTLTMNDYLLVYEKIKKPLVKHWDEPHDQFNITISGLVDVIFQEDCGSCCYELIKDPKRRGWVLCKNCNKLAHMFCYCEWDKKDKGCMYCRYKKGDPLG